MKKLVVTVKPEEFQTLPLGDIVSQGWKLEIQEKEDADGLFVEIIGSLVNAKASNEAAENLVVAGEWTWADE